MVNDTKGREISRQMLDFVNNMSHNNSDFVQGVMDGHRTLQQSSFGLIMDTIKAWSDMYDRGYFDERNEDTCKLCHKIYTENKDDWYVSFI